MIVYYIILCYSVVLLLSLLQPVLGHQREHRGVLVPGAVPELEDVQHVLGRQAALDK